MPGKTPSDEPPNGRRAIHAPHRGDRPVERIVEPTRILSLPLGETALGQRAFHATVEQAGQNGHP